LRLNELHYENENEEINMEDFKNHYSADIPLDSVLNLYPKYYQAFHTEKFEDMINSEKMTKYFNNVEEGRLLEPVFTDEIDDFNKIVENDKFFTFVKHPRSLSTVLFIAEIMTENSKNFPEVCKIV
jgi:hypothetical protein